LNALEFFRAHSFTGEDRSFFREERLFLLSISISIGCAELTAKNVRIYAEFFGQIASFFDRIGSAEGLIGDGNGDVAHGFLSGTVKK